MRLPFRRKDRKLSRREYADLEHFMLNGFHYKTRLRDCSKCERLLQRKEVKS